jgi:nicotinate phosphoribosyltransferase
VIDFGSRRAHGPQAGLLAARAAFIGGCAGTSNTEAARLLGVPAVGTMAHAYVMAYDDETEAFRTFGRVFPHATLLVDTYDTVAGTRNALASGVEVRAVRLDSGDLAALSKEVRRVLDAAGRQAAQIVASGDLNEYKVRALVAAGAPIDVFGVGTELVTSRDDPSLNTVYKLVEIDTPQGPAGRFKLSTAKSTYPYAKQVFRQHAADGTYSGDLVARADEHHPGEPLLVPVLQGGEPCAPLPTVLAARARCAAQLSRLPHRLLALEPATPYGVWYSDLLDAELRRLAAARADRTANSR